MKNNKIMVSIEKILFEDIQRREALNPEYFYKAKIPAVRHAQSLGIDDSTIETMFGIKLKEEDKKK